MKISDIQKSNIISYAAGIMQSITFILIFLLWKYYAELTLNQNLILGAMIIVNEILTYVLMRMASEITKEK